MSKITLPSKKEDYLLKIKITGENGLTLDDLRCKFYLPKKYSERAEMYILPSNEQGNYLFRDHASFWKFSFIGERRELSGETFTISANRAFSIEMSSRMWGDDLNEYIWKVEPLDLKVQRRLDRKESPTEGRFKISPNKALTPATPITQSYTGDVKVHVSRTRKYKLTNGLSLNFQKHYEFQDNSQGDTVMFGQLVAESNLWKDQQGHLRINDLVLREIDDFLLVAAIATRTFTNCIGWQVYDTTGITEFYRGDVSLPSSNKKNRDDDLIDLRYQQEFIKYIYSKFSKDSQIDLVRSVLYSLLPDKRSTMESTFTGLFSAMETLVLVFRREHGFEFIFGTDHQAWSQFKEESFKPWLKMQPLFSGEENTDRRKLLYENLAALERISFSHAFKKFCEYYSIDLSDLWPVSGGGQSHLSLTAIRNKLVHGDIIYPYQYRALNGSMLHLQWTLERMLLAYLGWDISKSNVCKAYLSPYNEAYKNLDADRKLISS